MKAIIAADGGSWPFAVVLGVERTRTEKRIDGGVRGSLHVWSHFLAENRFPLFRKMLQVSGGRNLAGRLLQNR
jgi:hypothetical protein